MNHEHKLDVIRRLTKTAVATLTANRNGPPMNTEAKPQIQAATDGVAIQNSLIRGRKLLASPPPSTSGSARKPLASKTKKPKALNTASFGTGMPKMATAEAKIALVEALLEKRANRVRGGIELGKRIWNWAARGRRSYDAPAPPPVSNVSRGLEASRPQKVKSFFRGVREGVQRKGTRDAAAVQRQTLREQRRITDATYNTPITRTPKFDPKTYSPGIRKPKPVSTRTVAIREARQISGRTPKLIEPRAAPRPSGNPLPQSGGTIAERLMATSRQNLARNELAQGAGRLVGTPIGMLRDAAPKLTQYGLTIPTTVGLTGGAGYHMYKNMGTSGIMNTMGAGVKDTYGAITNPTGFNLSRTVQAAEKPLKNLPTNFNPAKLSPEQMKVNNIPAEAAELAERYGTGPAGINKANQFLKDTGQTGRFNSKWQRVQKGSNLGPGIKNDTGKLSPGMTQYLKKLRNNDPGIRQQNALDKTLQNTGN